MLAVLLDKYACIFSNESPCRNNQDIQSVTRCDQRLARGTIGFMTIVRRKTSSDVTLGWSVRGIVSGGDVGRARGCRTHLR